MADASPMIDAATVDAGLVDSGTPDTGPADTGPVDTGPPPPDQDRDGIPDDEDPEPQRVNPPLLNDPFNENGDWIFSSVSMEIDGAEGVLTVDAIEPFEREGWIGPRGAWADYFIRSLIRVDEVGTSNDARSGHAGVIARVVQVTPSRYLTCGIDLKLGRVVLAAHEGTSRTVLAEAPTSAVPGTWLKLGFTALRNAFICEIGGVRVEGASALFDAGSVGFRSYDATFAADWIEVYEILP